jgi:hypothetical protein
VEEDVADQVPRLYEFGPLRHDNVQFTNMGHHSLDALLHDLSQKVPAFRRPAFKNGTIKIALSTEGTYARVTLAWIWLRELLGTRSLRAP